MQSFLRRCFIYSYATGAGTSVGAPALAGLLAFAYTDGYIALNHLLFPIFTRRDYEKLKIVPCALLVVTFLESAGIAVYAERPLKK